MAVRNIFVFLCVLSVVYGFQSFQLQIPNGRKVMHPCNGGIPWPTVGHANYTHMKTKNLFGEVSLPFVNAFVIIKEKKRLHYIMVHSDILSVRI